MIEKLFLHDFTVGNRVQSRFVHLHPLALHWAIFWCDVILEAVPAADECALVEQTACWARRFCPNTKQQLKTTSDT